MNNWEVLSISSFVPKLNFQNFLYGGIFINFT
jgi:hypothetical protein